MRQLRVWLEDPVGQRVVLEVKQGTRYAQLLYVPTLERIEMPLDELARQERSGCAVELPISRGLIGRIEERRRQAREYRRRYPEAFVKEALTLIRADRRGE